MQNQLDDTSKRKWDLAILTGLTLLALATRSYGIAEWHLVQDEVFTVTHAADRYTSLRNPAYYVLVMGSFKLFGVSEWAARLPAMLLGILSVPVFYVTCRSVLGRNVALIGALLIIFSSWHLWYSQFSRFYAGVFLFGLLSYFLYYKAIRLGNPGYLAWAMLANVLGILFHATSVMVPASCATFSAFVLLSKQAAGSDYSRRIATIHLAFCVVSGLIAVFLFWHIVELWYAAKQSWGYGPAGLVLQIAKKVQIPIVLSAIFGMIFLLQRDVLRGIFFAAGIGIPVVALLVGSAVIPPTRPIYMFYALPLVLALAAFLCEEARQALLKHRFAAHALTIIVIASLLPEWVSHYTGRKSLDVRQAVAFVEDAYQPGDRILSFVKEFNYYTGNQYPIEPRLGLPRNNKVAWTQVLEPYQDGKQRVWIILRAWRKPLAKEFESWLLSNSSLVWRKYEKRYDYTVKGYEIFLVRGSESGFSS